MAGIVSTTDSRVNESIGVIVFVPYGRCCDLPALTGKGQIDAIKEYRGITYVHVQPVEGLPLPKWVNINQVQYDFAANAKAAGLTAA